MLSEILARVLDFWHPWKAGPHFQRAVNKPVGLQGLEGKSNGGGDQEVRVHPRPLDTSALSPCCSAVPCLGWKPTHSRIGHPRCPQYSDRDGGKHQESQRGAPLCLCKTCFSFPFSPQASQQSDWLSPEHRWALEGTCSTSQLQGGAGFSPSPFAPGSPLPTGLCHLSPSSLQNPSCTWLFASFLPSPAFLCSGRFSAFVFPHHRTVCKHRVKAARERMRRTTSHHQHFLAFHGEGKG